MIEESYANMMEEKNRKQKGKEIIEGLLSS